MAAAKKSTASVGLAGGERTSSGERQIPFATHKAAFDLYAVIVAPDARVWVERTRPFGATNVLYDIFDERGVRVDRVELPARNRVIGFGPSSVYTNERDADGRATLKKYKL